MPDDIFCLLSISEGLKDLWTNALPNHFPSPEAKLYSPPNTLLYFSLLFKNEYSLTDSLFKKKNEKFDATDALGAAICHFYQKSNNQTPKKSWKEYVISNPEKLI